MKTYILKQKDSDLYYRDRARKDTGYPDEATKFYEIEKAKATLDEKLFLSENTRGDFYEIVELY